MHPSLHTHNITHLCNSPEWFLVRRQPCGFGRIGCAFLTALIDHYFVAAYIPLGLKCVHWPDSTSLSPWSCLTWLTTDLLTLFHLEQFIIGCSADFDNFQPIK